MLFLQFILYSSSFVGALKNEIPGAALELFQLKIKQFSLEILKFSIKKKRPVPPVFPDCLCVSYDYGNIKLFDSSVHMESVVSQTCLFSGSSCFKI